MRHPDELGKFNDALLAFPWAEADFTLLARQLRFLNRVHAVFWLRETAQLISSTEYPGLTYVDRIETIGWAFGHIV